MYTDQIEFLPGRSKNFSTLKRSSHIIILQVLCLQISTLAKDKPSKPFVFARITCLGLCGTDFLRFILFPETVMNNRQLGNPCTSTGWTPYDASDDSPIPTPVLIEFNSP